VTRWEASVHSISCGWDCTEEYTLDLFERECLHEDLDHFAAQGQQAPEALQARIDAADPSFRRVIRPGSCVWDRRECYDPVLYWYNYRWPRW
jgi:hypothetical protein